MLPCDNRRRGCSEVFDKAYGLRIHLRSCIHKQRRVRSQRKGKTSYLLPVHSVQRYEVMNTNYDDEGTRDDYEDHQGRFAVSNILELLEEDSNGKVLDLSPVEKIMLKLGQLTRAAGRRSVSELISLLRTDNYCLESFQDRCTDVRECVKLEESIISSHLSEQGFKLVAVSDPKSGIECDIYMRSPMVMLRKQLEGSSNENTVYNPTAEHDSENLSHPFDGRLGTEGVPAVMKLIMSHLGTESLWYTDESNGQQSFVGMLQLYSDKSRTTLKESAFQFYPFHATFLNFSDSYRRHCIIKGLTLIAFLPVNFYRRIDGERIKMGLNRLERLKMLHLSLERILLELKEQAYVGFSCFDRKKNARICHPCIGGYCCDLPEGKDLTSVKNGNSSSRNCHRCLARTDTFNTYTTDLPRSGKETVTLIQRAIALRKESRGKDSDALLHDLSLVEQIPFLQSFPFVGCTPVLDFHSIFYFEPLHNFHLGTSKDLKRCLSERLKSEDLFSSALPTKGGKNRTASFKTLRLTVLFGINRILSHIQSFSPAKGLRIDFSTSTTSYYGSGLYVDDGKLVGMLEGKDYKSIDMVSPFIGMVVDRCCDEVSSAPTTNLFVQYVNVMQMALSYNNHSMSWTEQKVKRLEDMIRTFKWNALSLYGSYHASMLCTEKFHQLDHIGEDICKMGGLRSGDAGLYEHEHTDIKRANRSGSRKKKTAMEETISSYVKDKYYRCEKSSHFNEVTYRQKKKGINASRNAMDSDSVCLVQTSKPITIGDIDRGYRLIRRLRIANQEENDKKIDELSEELGSITKNIQELLKDIGESGCRILINELLNTPLDNESGSELNRDSIIRRVASGYVSGIQAPTSENYDKRWNKIRVSQCSSRRSQRIVSARGFGGSSVLRQDSVLIQASDPSPSGSLTLWVGKVLGLFRLLKCRTSESMESGKEEHEAAFVQFYEATPPVDNIDKALGCIRLVWARAHENYQQTTGTNDINTQPVSPWYSLIPASSIRGVVHVVRGDYGLNGLGVVKDVDSAPWHEQHFYINKYYFECGTVEEEIHDG